MKEVTISQIDNGFIISENDVLLPPHEREKVYVETLEATLVISKRILQKKEVPIV